MKWDELDDNWCPVARALSVFGDRWTLLIVRDCFLGHSKFEEFARNSGMTRHVLAARLARLVEAGILEKRQYSHRPQRFDYVLTAKGEELGPALRNLRDWGRRHMPVQRPSRSVDSSG